MKRSGKKMEKLITPVLGGAVGFVGSKFLNQVPFISDNPTVGSISKLAAGMLLATQKGEMVQSVGLGVAIGGANDLLDQLMPAGAGVGYLPNTNANQVLGTRRGYARNGSGSSRVVMQ